MEDDAPEATETEEVTPPSADASETDKSGSTPATAKADAAAESPSDDDAEADGESEPKEWVNLVEKGKGDKAVIGKMFWDAQNANAKLAKENKALLARLEAASKTAPEASKAEPAKPEPKPLTDHPSIQKLESTITALETEKANIQTKGQAKFEELKTQRKLVDKLEARIEDQGEIADEALKTRFEMAKDRSALLETQLEDLTERFNAKKERLAENIARREAVRAEAEEEGKRQTEQQAKNAEFNSEYPQRIDAMMIAAADDLGLPTDPEIRQDLWETVNTKMMAKLFHLGKGVPLESTDEQALIRGFVERFAKTHGFASKAKFAGTSKEKAKVAGHKIVPGAPLIQKKAPPPSLGFIDDDRAKDTKLMEARKKMLARFGATP